MGKSAQDIVKQYIADTGQNPKGDDLHYCLDFAAVLIKMEEDQKKSTVSARNCLHYAESRAEEGHTISHGTIYNNPILKSMMNWAIKRSEQGILPDASKDLAKINKELKEELRKKEKKIKGLTEKVQMIDCIIHDYNETKIRELDNFTLMNRAFDILKMYGLECYMDYSITPEDRSKTIPTNFTESIIIDNNTKLEQHKDNEIDDQ